MKNQASIHSILRLALVFGAVTLAGCPDDPAEDGDTGTGTGSESGSETMVTPPPESSSDGVDTISPDSSGSSTAGETETTSGEDPFVFPTDPYDAYTQIDRHGAVEAGTAGILASAGLGLNGRDLSLRDEYNASNPAEDAMGVWLDEIIASVTFFHDSFDDDLIGLGLTPADVDETLQQAGPVIVPDTIKYDPAAPTGYPNGRALTDQVVDITLAAVLLDLGEHDITTFSSIPLNPAENDVPFRDEFPYLADPHPPK